MEHCPLPHTLGMGVATNQGIWAAAGVSAADGGSAAVGVSAAGGGSAAVGVLAAGGGLAVAGGEVAVGLAAVAEVVGAVGLVEDGVAAKGVGPAASRKQCEANRRDQTGVTLLTCNDEAVVRK